MSQYSPRNPLRWIATECTNHKCKNKDAAIADVLKSGHVPACDICGSPMEFEPGDLRDDPA